MIKSDFIDKNVQKYLNSSCIRLTPIQRKLHEQSLGLNEEVSAHVRSVECSQLIQIFIKSSHAKNCLEIGALAGYNTVAMALALPKHGHVISIDLTDRNLNPLKNLWKEAGVEHKITLKLGDAGKILDDLTQDHESKFDLILVDCDAKHVISNYEKSLRLLKSDGIMFLNGVLNNGKVADLTINDEETKAMRELNLKLQVDDRIDIKTTLSVGNGLVILLKK